MEIGVAVPVDALGVRVGRTLLQTGSIDNAVRRSSK